ncbi:MAG: phosphatidylinositol kinase [Roseobacter sp.]|nr:phosphatidylinositol kinase [Roseobacter sp.]HBM38948.1 phosphatidylinositol kinase [Sulfitobacter sp.]
MTSDLLKPTKTLYVWIFLPGATDPMVAGRVDLVGQLHQFTYGKSYLRNPDAIPIFLPELPLVEQIHVPAAPLQIAGCLRDGAPDFWGRRVIINRLTGTKGIAMDLDALDEMNYMLQSGSDRIGALDFQSSATEYVPRLAGEVVLSTLIEAADLVERGVPLPMELDEALRHGEYIAMKIAQACGMNVAPVELRQVMGKDVLLIERFDRINTGQGWTRRAMVSALTILGLSELQGRYASYEDLATHLRRASFKPSADLQELFARMCFNILVGNTDDHARNHAGFWTGEQLQLTPAYDIDPRPRASYEANQAMAVHGTDHRTNLSLALDAAGSFGLDQGRAERVILGQVEAIRDLFDEIARDVDLTPADYTALWERAFLQL